MRTEDTGIFATDAQLKEVTDSYQLGFRTPMMAVLPGGKVLEPKEDFRDKAKRFAREAGLEGESFAIDPETREFVRIID